MNWGDDCWLVGLLPNECLFLDVDERGLALICAGFSASVCDGMLLILFQSE